MTEVNQNTKELVITRIFDAPRELVFKAWTDPKLVAQWWGPQGFTNPVCELDVRLGGAIRIDMRGPDGVVVPMKGVFHEIVEPERLVFTTSAFEDEQGNPGLENLNTVTFAELDGKTKLTFHTVVVKAVPEVAGALAGMEEGWNQSLDKLAEHLGGSMQNSPKLNMTVNPEKREIISTRIFDAPRELVFKVYTDPELVPQWWGPRNVTTIVDKMDVRVGGVWRYIHKDAEGNEYAFNGVYQEVKAPDRLTYTFEFEPMAGHVSTETLTFEEQPDGKTKITARTTFDALEDLEGMLQSGMEEGAVETYDRLAELLQEIQKEPRNQ